MSGEPPADLPMSCELAAAHVATAGFHTYPFSSVGTGFAQFTANQREDIAMHFCLTGQYTPQALNNIMDNPTTNRYEAAKNLIEAAGGKLISMYSTAADGPGVLVIIDVDPTAAPAISGVLVASGALHNVTLTRLWTQDEIKQVR